MFLTSMLKTCVRALSLSNGLNGNITPIEGIWIGDKINYFSKDIWI